MGLLRRLVALVFEPVIVIMTIRQMIEVVMDRLMNRAIVVILAQQVERRVDKVDAEKNGDQESAREALPWPSRSPAGSRWPELIDPGHGWVPWSKTTSMMKEPGIIGEPWLDRESKS